ncbi:DUF4251 domain-containing protein [Mucilaginibacter auburnensis]|uniref:Uncharacterized protein DUF4251 n=1 Tax=Mucilaginibacter auburnensis TaxID=1457233 RepID=A0A2H9VMC9_9SPHI|nr:DUF4251 domain-containing protein [Mucilaginibacter auburnensis]PJJ79501.1 uncharacterized protein DUF4251 [Mucilaginibacter auburnensis]
MKNTLKIFFAVAVCVLFGEKAISQTTAPDKKATQIAELKRIVDGKNYIFKATTAMPTTSAGVQVSGNIGGPNSVLNQLNSGMINLTGSYDVSLKNDSLSVFLPYYGTAFSAPINPTEGGIKLNTTKFDYNVAQKKKGSLQITFKPQKLETRSPADVYRMILSVSPGGYATLQVISVNRMPITFNGMVEEIKPQEAKKS